MIYDPPGAPHPPLWCPTFLVTSPGLGSSLRKYFGCRQLLFSVYLEEIICQFINSKGKLFYSCGGKWKLFPFILKFVTDNVSLVLKD